MDPDETLRLFWQAWDAKSRATAQHDAKAYVLAADEALDAAADLFNWLADGGFAPDWARPVRD